MNLATQIVAIFVLVTMGLILNLFGITHYSDHYFMGILLAGATLIGITPGVFKPITDRYAAWKKKREWPAEEHIEYIRQIIRTDSEWLGHDPTARAITERYLKVLQKDWYQQPHPWIADFRSQIGLDPDYKKE